VGAALVVGAVAFVAGGAVFAGAVVFAVVFARAGAFFVRDVVAPSAGATRKDATRPMATIPNCARFFMPQLPPSSR
jgi:hypothetical protein